jgi:hypothetical protein
MAKHVWVKKYRGYRTFQKDATKMYADGWGIVGQSSRKQMYSLMAGLFTRKQISTVTWEKEIPA